MTALAHSTSLYLSPLCSKTETMLLLLFSDWPNVRVALGVFGKFFVATSFDAIYTWSVEIYPTVVRYVLPIHFQEPLSSFPPVKSRPS